MFNLDREIKNWRRQLIAAGIKTPVPLDELESHLREDVEQQVRAGIVLEKALALAVERIGSAAILKAEFERVENPARLKRRKWLRLISILAGTAFLYIMISIAWGYERRRGIEITNSDVFWMWISMAATLSFGFSGGYFGKFLPVIISEVKQAVLTIGVLFAAASVFRLFWSDFTADSLVHTQIIFLWTFSPLLGVTNCFAVWCDNCDAARRAMKAQ
jgi:hypothetical protein